MSGFHPIVGARPSVLILGSMPSQISLANEQYYANPRNSFWWIVSQIFGFDATVDYHEREKLMKRTGAAVWDVLFDCERPGSADSAIQRSSEVVNDFVSFFERFSTIKKIGFNGATAEKIFFRHCRELVTHYKLETQLLPSTSPAYASMPVEVKLQHWQFFIRGES